MSETNPGRKYLSEPLPEKGKELRKINKVHFLIHPGFAWLQHSYRDYPVNKGGSLGPAEATAKTMSNIIYTGLRKGAPRNFDKVYSYIIQMYEEYLDSEIGHARKIGGDEIVIAFLFGDMTAVKRQLGTEHFAFYTEKINQLKKQLKSRLIVFTDSPPLRSIATPTLEGIEVNGEHLTLVGKKIHALAKARGYEISQEVISYGYGEEILACVSIGSANLNKTLKLKYKTKILPANTSLGDHFGLSVEQYNQVVRASKTHGNITIKHPYGALSLTEYLKYINLQEY